MANHKWPVKDTVHNTQKRPAEFTSQCALQAYQRYVVRRAYANVEATDQRLYVTPQVATGLKQVRWSGEYVAQVTNIGLHQKATGTWASTAKKQVQCEVDKEFASITTEHLLSLDWTDEYCLTGYTEMALHIGNQIE